MPFLLSFLTLTLFVLGFGGKVVGTNMSTATQRIREPIKVKRKDVVKIGLNRKGKGANI